jgi:hypothetical protein
MEFLLERYPPIKSSALWVQLPLCAGVRDAESVTFSIALGIAAGRGHYHCQIASVIEGVAHAFPKERGLQTTTT